MQVQGLSLTFPTTVAGSPSSGGVLTTTGYSYQIIHSESWGNNHRVCPLCIQDGFEPKFYLSPGEDTIRVGEITHNRRDEHSANTSI